MATYFLYISIFLIVSSFAYIAQYGNDISLRISARFICFFSMLVPAALRYEIGADYSAYIVIYAEGFPDHRQTMEPGFRALGLLCYMIGLPPHFFIVVVSGITYGIICFLIDRKYCFPIILFYMMTLYLHSFNIIRMVLGMSFFLYGLQSNFNGKTKKGLIFYAVSISMHFAMSVVVLLTLLSHIKINKYLRYIVLIGVPFFLYYIVIHAMDILVLLSPRLVNYQLMIGYRTEVNTGLTLILPAIPSIIVFLNQKHFLKIEKGDFILNINMCYVLVVIGTFFIAAFFRLSTAFVFLPLFSIIYIYKYCKLRKIYHYVFFIIYFAIFIRFIMTNEGIGAEINPYRSIFSSFL